MNSEPLNSTPVRCNRRKGAVLLWCALLLPVLLSMVGLVVEVGIMMANYREAQNAADAAALVAANDLLQGKITTTASSDACVYVLGSGTTTYNNLASLPSGSASVSLYFSPSIPSGPYQSSTGANYVQAVVTIPQTIWLLPVLPGISKTQTVTARAVAGYETSPVSAGVIALSPTGTGIDIEGSAKLDITGSAGVVLANSSGTGTTNGTAAVYMSGSAIIQAGVVDTTSGDKGVERTNSSAKIENSSGTTVPAQTASPTPDPFESLPTPNTSNGLSNSTSSNVSITSTPASNLNPGIYVNGISVSRGATVTLNPGIYVLKGGGLSLGGNATVNGTGVMFYNTGSDYTSAGTPDSTDNSTPDPFNHSPVTDSSATFGQISVSNGATLNVTPPTTGVFAGMLIYQRRANPDAITITGGAGGSSGTIYAKWATATINNGAAETIAGQIIANKLIFTGNAAINLSFNSGSNLGQAIKVYLVD